MILSLVQGIIPAAAALVAPPLKTLTGKERTTTGSKPLNPLCLTERAASAKKVLSLLTVHLLLLHRALTALPLDLLRRRLLIVADTLGLALPGRSLGLSRGTVSTAVGALHARGKRAVFVLELVLGDAHELAGRGGSLEAGDLGEFGVVDLFGRVS